MVSLSALRTGRLFPQEVFLVKLSQPQNHSVDVRIISIKKPNDPIGNGNRDLPACSAVLQPTAPPRIAIQLIIFSYSFLF
jgi:hypothetical protein